MRPRLAALALAAAAGSTLARVAWARNHLALTPPMGWMSWEIFRCNLNTTTDDCTDPKTTKCISEALYRGIADALVSSGLAGAGYASVHMDDCWEERSPPRDPATNELRGDLARFPSGMKALGDYVHAAGLSFAMYTAESPQTCEGYPASLGNEELDARTFASWGVDYLKVDGCGNRSLYEQAYARMGAALEASGRDIVYSCSWPAYINASESEKPYGQMIMDGCNLWRNRHDIQCSPPPSGKGAFLQILDYFGDSSAVLAPWTGPGHWSDPDMLIIGNGCISIAEERTQMAIWSILAAPLIMGNDPRSVPAASLAILTNPFAIAVDQDPLGQMGVRLEPLSAAPLQRWARVLVNGDVAVALLNRGGGPSADITLQFADVSLQSPVTVFGIWAQKSLGAFDGNFTAAAVGLLDSAFLRLTGSNK